MTFQWPGGFPRVPDQDWARNPVETLALKYDTVEGHGWYRNLEPTLDQLQAYLRDGQILVDYSGGTGILVDRLLKRAPDLAAGLLIVDASPKFLRCALDKLGDDPRVAFRWIRYLKPERRLETVDEVLPDWLLERGVDAIVSTNAIHLYYGLPETLGSWTRILRPGGAAFVQSGNIANPSAAPGEWIIDETVDAIHRTAMELVEEEDTFARYRGLLADTERMEKYDQLRRKYFIPVRPLAYYVDALRDAGLEVERVENRSIEAEVADWYDFLAVYHEGVLGWVGGTERIDGAPPTERALQDRLSLIGLAMHRLFRAEESFQACWTYLTCRKP